MMSVRELQILGEEREEKDRMWCKESLFSVRIMIFKLQSKPERKAKAISWLPETLSARQA